MTLAAKAVGLNYAEITCAANDVLKDALIHKRERVNEADIREMLAERRSITDKLGE